ncbi:PP2C family protein-serine/threonine phosphatase [Luteimicrobium subarcticum]|uniref:Protein phosphatase n=1 Tax=Luteimicrobium subarcticum TaxID=620910 RepID=A0A2M8WJE4_9MICO|nr:PP2C family serine/threonine-protein phosphatase [Luteimicrobium subarcticum]PJI91049.1 protein phosphatase [Luteimicrobium subarcticum]
MTFALRYAARSDVGLVRADNQDSGYAGPDLVVVADGMGGHAGGDIASALAVGALAHLDGHDHSPVDGPGELEVAIETARESIVARSTAEPRLAGMGTTVTALLRAGDTLVMAHLGDSRAYLLHDDELVQVTTDHTFVQHLVDTGRIAPEEAEHHPQRNVVMRVLGDFEVDLTPDISVREAVVGDRWMLCSDGLSGFVGADTMTQILISVEDPGACADTLVQLALRAGSTDNVTCVIADVVGMPDAADATTEAVPVDGAPTTESPDAAYSPTLPVVVEVVGSAAREHVVPLAGDDAAADDVLAVDNDEAGDDSSDDAADSPDDAAERPADGDAPPAPTGRRRLLAVGATLLALVLVMAGGYAAYGWTQKQYFVGTSDGQVAVFRGVPQSVGPITLSTPVELTGVQVSTLPSYVADRLDQTIPASSLADAETIARDVVTGTVPTPGPTATGSPTSDPTAATPGPTATPGSTTTARPRATATTAPRATPPHATVPHARATPHATRTTGSAG